jgi:plasmid stability protein
MNLTVKSLPDELGEALKMAAKSSNRSMNREIIDRLMRSFDADISGVNNLGAIPRVNESPDEVADAWSKLAGKWKSTLSVDEEIAALYETRSGGRDLDLSW